jgi:hypothetical protein
MNSSSSPYSPTSRTPTDCFATGTTGSAPHRGATWNHRKSGFDEENGVQKSVKQRIEEEAVLAKTVAFTDANGAVVGVNPDLVVRVTPFPAIPKSGIPYTRIDLVGAIGVNVQGEVCNVLKKLNRAAVAAKRRTGRVQAANVEAWPTLMAALLNLSAADRAKMADILTANGEGDL